MKLALCAMIFALVGMQQNSGKPVPVANEPSHHRVTDNPVIRVYDVVVQPGAATLFHVHERDYFFVNFGDAELLSQTPGRPEQPLNLRDGEVRYTAAVLTHRIRNVGRTAFHNLTVELMKPAGASSGSATATADNQAPVLENNRIRALRVLLPAGGSTGMHSHPARTLMVMVSGGSIRIESAGRKAEPRVVKPGDFIWLDSAVEHSLVNTGTNAMQVVEVEVK